MTIQDNPAHLKAATTYNAAAEHFDDEPLAFWERHGRRAVELADLKPGERVLDMGCGTGASALPAALAVGPGGFVTGIDIAGNMLALARDKAAALGIDNIRFELLDQEASGFPSAGFDAVISVFSIFFTADMVRQLAEFWRLVRPGGRLVVTTWGVLAFQPGADIFSAQMRAAKPDLPAATRPWERLTSADSLRRLFADAGAAAPDIWPVEDSQPLRTPEDWWTIALGSGYRWEIDQLTAEQRHAARQGTLRRLSRANITAVATNVLHAVARKPGR